MTLARPLAGRGVVPKHNANGTETGRKLLLAVDREFRIDVPALEQAIARDRDAGYHPFCIVGNAGTVKAGAIDNLDALADICEREDLWLHVDGAFVALGRCRLRCVRC